MKISEADRQIIVGALDSLGVSLADHDHEWTVGERTIYEEAINVLTASSPSRMAADLSAIGTCAASPPANRPTQACAPISTRSRGLVYFARRVAAVVAWIVKSKPFHCYAWICSLFLTFYLTAPLFSVLALRELSHRQKNCRATLAAAFLPQTFSAQTAS